MSHDAPELFDARTIAVCGLLLTALEDHELDVIRCRYWELLTEQEIGEQIGEGRERVHRIIRTAHGKMRRWSDSVGLTDTIIDDLNDEGAA